MSDSAIGVAGDIAGAAADPRRGLTRLRAAATGRTVTIMAAGLVIGYLAARRRRR